MKKMMLAASILFSGYANAAQTGYLFFQSDSEASITKNADNSYTLTLQHVPAYVSYFSNRPERVTGLIPLPKFIQLWSNSSGKDSFLSIPPNVAFAMLSKSGKAQNFIATVSKPAYSDDQLQYTLNIIGKNKIETGQMAHVDIFFDDIPWNSGGFGG